jgi:hypothetical protein
MAVADLPLADVATLRRMMARGDWVMLAVHEDEQGFALLERLYPEDEALRRGYRWVRVDLGTDQGDAVLAERGIAPGNRYVILSPFQGAVGLWVLDDLGGREPEDLLGFMDDHADELELEEYADEFDDLS